MDMGNKDSKERYKRQWREMMRLKLYVIEQQDRLLALWQKQEAFLLCPSCPEKICKLTAVDSA